MGEPLGDFTSEKGALTRRFTRGWAAVNVSDQHSGELDVPPGMRTFEGEAAETVTLAPHKGVLFRPVK